MLRRFLLGVMVVSLASVALAGVPDLVNSTAVVPDGAAGASVFVLPNGQGVGFDEAFGAGGGVVDATITLTLVDALGNPIFLYPFEDLWLETSGGGLAACSNGTGADGSTNVSGQTTWTASPAAGGHTEGETVLVMIAGAALSGGGLNMTFNSADINGDLSVNLTDIVAFSQAMTSGYAYSADFNNDGSLNLSDIVRLAGGNGVSCN